MKRTSVLLVCLSVLLAACSSPPQGAASSRELTSRVLASFMSGEKESLRPLLYCRDIPEQITRQSLDFLLGGIKSEPNTRFQVKLEPLDNSRSPFSKGDQEPALVWSLKPTHVLEVQATYPGTPTQGSSSATLLPVAQQDGRWFVAMSRPAN